MKRERYQISYKTTICGKEYECLCSEETESGNWCICYNEADAEKRVAELIEAGYEARYEELPYDEAWFDYENWIG